MSINILTFVNFLLQYYWLISCFCIIHTQLWLTALQTTVMFDAAARPQSDPEVLILVCHLGFHQGQELCFFLFVFVLLWKFPAGFYSLWFEVINVITARNVMTKEAASPTGLLHTPHLKSLTLWDSEVWFYKVLILSHSAQNYKNVLQPSAACCGQLVLLLPKSFCRLRK